mmetsp:Transcript_18170/g.30970  ORF Transcript_18170/g.30970 Transcript_18170/m.30970 type:complete len:331 (-) Transcript_18170:300-1292(-)
MVGVGSKEKVHVGSSVEGISVIGSRQKFPDIANLSVLDDHTITIIGNHVALLVDREHLHEGAVSCGANDSVVLWVINRTQSTVQLTSKELVPCLPPTWAVGTQRDTVGIKDGVRREILSVLGVQLLVPWDHRVSDVEVGGVVDETLDGLLTDGQLRITEGSPEVGIVDQPIGESWVFLESGDSAWAVTEVLINQPVEVAQVIKHLLRDASCGIAPCRKVGLLWGVLGIPRKEVFVSSVVERPAVDLSCSGAIEGCPSQISKDVVEWTVKSDLGIIVCRRERVHKIVVEIWDGVDHIIKLCHELILLLHPSINLGLDSALEIIVVGSLALW